MLVCTKRQLRGLVGSHKRSRSSKKGKWQWRKGMKIKYDPTHEFAPGPQNQPQLLRNFHIDGDEDTYIKMFGCQRRAATNS